MVGIFQQVQNVHQTGCVLHVGLGCSNMEKHRLISCGTAGASKHRLSTSLVFVVTI